MARKRRGEKVDGWVVLDKPEGLNSTRAVSIVRRLFDAAKAGHAGTLDPLATGVLPIALGEATKTVPFVMDGRKAYRFTVRWGEARTTDDREGEVSDTSDVRPAEADILAVLPRFLGEIEQVPPRYSAIKIDGERAYDLARANVPIEMKSRIVTLTRLDLLRIVDADHAEFEVDCGKGTYVRSLARDLALALGTVGHVTSLRRTRSGPFTLEHAISLDLLEESAQGPGLQSHLLPIETALDDIPALALNGSEASQLRSGQPIPMFRAADIGRLGDLDKVDIVCAMAEGRPVALTRFAEGRLHPVRVFNL
ncbi:MAG: tRNA pseudouridine(55) synthase TruB [Oceanibaculum nanhaiense]|uniref:tRNA pseudouridine(55) synthase TruB n=1 Tax=Oceanibaculum nanhaiense TaxID=1909734 RepID=UPI0025A46D3D|nr:tRNA pseudouridine(55) synthase TruB [Oceanibaculum nanhaiense]MDM7945722.1 tRNA pseudouridine(55) synthase TruB [Oceanibaculum nanhaiense]